MGLDYNHQAAGDTFGVIGGLCWNTSRTATQAEQRMQSVLSALSQSLRVLELQAGQAHSACGTSKLSGRVRLKTMLTNSIPGKRGLQQAIRGVVAAQRWSQPKDACKHSMLQLLVGHCLSMSGHIPVKVIKASSKFC